MQFVSVRDAARVGTRSDTCQYAMRQTAVRRGFKKLSNTFEPQPWKADKPGRHRLLVDVFTDTGVQPYEHPFEVVEP